eukprot:69290_1
MSHGHTVFDKHRCNLLIYGYIGDIAKLFNNKTIPLSINEMILVYYFITFDSVILNSKDTQMFVQLLADTKRNIETEFESEYKLLYRATNDGWKYDTFFDKCKDAKQTLTIIQTDSNNVFGGYTSIPWRNDNRWRVDDAAFLFLIRSSKQYKPQIFPLISSQRNMLFVILISISAHLDWDMIYTCLKRMDKWHSHKPNNVVMIYLHRTI